MVAALFVLENDLVIVLSSATVDDLHAHEPKSASKAENKPAFRPIAGLHAAFVAKPPHPASCAKKTTKAGTWLKFTTLGKRSNLELPQNHHARKHAAQLVREVWY